jgi:hypothetical protein
MIKWAGHVARMGRRGKYIDFGGNTRGKGATREKET